MKVKKIFSVLFILIFSFSISPNTYNMEQPEYSQAMTSQEIEVFLETALPVPIPDPQKSSSGSSKGSGGVSVYDVRTGTVTHKPLISKETSAKEESDPGYFPDGAEPPEPSTAVIAEDDEETGS